MLFRTALLTAFATQLAALPPFPGEPLNHPIAEHSSITYAALLRLVCPDLTVKDDDAITGAGTYIVAIRDFDAATPPQPSEGEIDIQSVKTVAIWNTSQPRALLSLVAPLPDGDLPQRKLALFELTPTPRLLDVVAIGGFPDDAGDIESHFPIAPDVDAYVFESYHSNSSQGYQISSILFIRSNRIEKAVDVGLLSSHPYGDVQEFEEEVKFSTLPDPGHAYRAIVVRAALKHLADDPEHEYRPLRRASTRFYSAVYHWDAAARRFVTTSKGLAVLDAFNRKNN